MKTCISTLLFLLGILLLGYGQKISYEKAKEKLSQSTILTHYWTQKMGEYLISPANRNEKHEYKEAPCRFDSVPFIKGQIKTEAFCFSTTKGSFLLIVYNQEYEWLDESSGYVNIRSRFRSRSSWEVDLWDYETIREAYFTLSKTQAYSPTDSELDAYCKEHLAL